MLRTPICPYALAKLYKDGETIKNIAARFDCDLRTIRRRAERLGLRHPNSPDQRRKKMDTALRQINVIERYKDGESLMELAAAGDTSVDVVRGDLARNDVEIRTRIEQAKRTMVQHGTRSPKTATRYIHRLMIRSNDDPRRGKKPCGLSSTKNPRSLISSKGNI